MTLADDLLSVARDARGIAGTLGFRTHTVAVVVSYWAGQHTGEEHETDETTPLVEGGNQPPRVRPLNSEEIALGQLPADSLEIGPMTPSAELDALLFGDLPKGATRYIKVTGPIAPNGALYRINGSQRHKALRRVLTVSPVTATEP